MPTIQVFEGNILDAPSKNILVSIGENRVLQGETAKALAAKFWESLQTELLEGEPFKKWEVRLLEKDGYNILFGRPFDYVIRQLTIFWVEACMRAAFKICEEKWLKDIAISALSSRYLPNNQRQINAIAHLALETYFSETPNSVIENVWLVNYGETVFSTTEKGI